MKPFSKSVWMTPAHCGAVLLAGGEEGAQAEQVVGGVHEPRQRALPQSEGLQHLPPLVDVELRRLGL
jgi:hypothetical protein